MKHESRFEPHERIAEMPQRAPIAVTLIAAFGIALLGVSAVQASCFYSEKAEQQVQAPTSQSTIVQN